MIFKFAVPSFASLHTVSLHVIMEGACAFMDSDFVLEPCDGVYYGGNK